MPKDNTVILEDGEMNEIDRELEFKRFCLMIKPLKNRPRDKEIRNGQGQS